MATFRDVIVGIALLLIGSPEPASASSGLRCPSPALISATLGVHAFIPVKQDLSTFGNREIMCFYPGTGPNRASQVAITINATASAADFAYVENVAARTARTFEKLRGLGRAAWTTNAGVHVLDGHREVDVEGAWLASVLSPSSGLAKMEKLARALL